MGGAGFLGAILGPSLAQLLGGGVAIKEGGMQTQARGLM